jgi:predicted Zn-dependent peptidase
MTISSPANRKFVKVLPSGLRVICVPHPGPTATVLVAARAGSNLEKKAESGLAHLLEHMCFKGTLARAYRDWNIAVEALGGQANAETGNETVSYYAKGPAKSWRELLALVGETFAQSTFPEAEIGKERGVVVEEINASNDRPESQAADLVDEMLFRGHPASRPILGTKESVRGFGRAHLARFRDRHYVARNTVVVVAGPVDASEVFRVAEAALASLPRGRRAELPRFSSRQAKPRVRVARRQTDQAHLSLAFPAPGSDQASSPAWALLETVAGQGLSSRLHQKLREELGICYYVEAEHNAQSSYGSFVVSAGVAVDRVGEAVAAIGGELARLASEPLSRAELAKAKEYYASTYATALETSEQVALRWAEEALTARVPEAPSAWLARVRAVTAGDIRRAAKKTFAAGRANLALVGPSGGESSLEAALVESLG